MIRRGILKILFPQHAGIFRFSEKLGDGILILTSLARLIQLSRQICLTLDISFTTDTWASRNSPTTSCKLISIESSSPTARVIRAARLFLKLWSMFSSQGDPGAKNAL